MGSTATRSRSPVVEEVVRANAGRKPKRLRLKYRKMAHDAFAFFRGSDHLFARAWNDLKPPDEGPPVLCCGDLHLENFGAYHAEDGRFLFDVNDFDEASIAPCSFDLVRCTASILLAAELWGLSPLAANQMMLAFLAEYRKAIQHSAETGAVGEVDATNVRGPIKPLLGALASGSQVELLNREAPRDRDGRRRIHRFPDKRPEVGRKTRDLIREAVEVYGKGLGQASEFVVRDVTGRVAGVGSLGVRRYLVLVQGEGSPDRNALLDVKQAARSALVACQSAKAPEWGGGEAERVIRAQCLLQASPAAGLAQLEIDGTSFRMREMVPDENRSSLDRLRRRPGKLRRAVQVAGRLAAWGQARGARLDGADHVPDLASWAAGPALDSLMVCAARFAERTRRDHREFQRAYKHGQLAPHPE